MNGAARRWLQAVTTGPAWPLAACLAFAFVLRLPAVLFADGYDYVDQQYQYVDPAWHVASGQAWHRTWEWIDGNRSWVYPGFLAGVFRVLLWFGLDEPLWLMRAARGVHAAISLLPVWLFWLLVVRWRPLAAPRLPLLVFAGSGLAIATGVQPSGPALAATLATSAVLAFHGPRRWPLFAGACLGLAFCCRFQDAVFGVPLVAVALAQRRFAAIGWLLLGCVPGIALQGGVDLATHGAFLGSAWSYFEVNVLLGAASKWQQQPWWFYLVAGVVPVAALVPPFLGVGWRSLAAGARTLPAAAAAAVLHLAAHSFVARKALRFELAALWLCAAVVATGLAERAPHERRARGYAAALLAVHGALLLWASVWFGNAGAVRAALALRAEPAFAHELLVVDGDATSAGGFYYLRRDRLDVEGVVRAALRPQLEALQPGASRWIMVVREPLDPRVVAGIGRLEERGAFTGMLDLRRGDRRWLYRYESAR
jgi:hypothetical protein